MHAFDARNSAFIECYLDPRLFIKADHRNVYGSRTRQPAGSTYACNDAHRGAMLLQRPLKG